MTITGSDAADTLTIDGSIVAADVHITFNGGAGFDTVRGPPADSTWNITGSGAGTVGTITFADVENLVGAPDNKDTFVVAAGGSIAGTIDGGDGGFDTLVVDGNAKQLHASAKNGHDGVLKIGKDKLTYAGLEPISVTGPRWTQTSSSRTATTSTRSSPAIRATRRSSSSPLRPTPSSR